MSRRSVSSLRELQEDEGLLALRRFCGSHRCLTWYRWHMLRPFVVYCHVSRSDCIHFTALLTLCFNLSDFHSHVQDKSLSTTSGAPVYVISPCPVSYGPKSLGN